MIKKKHDNVEKMEIIL